MARQQSSLMTREIRVLADEFASVMGASRVAPAA